MLLYWIHRKEMTDPYTEGYVGITSNTAEQRLWEHNHMPRKSSVVKKAIDKYDDVEISVMFEGTKEECVQKEIEYRPSTNIGWNLAKGGGLPPTPVKGSDTAKKISQTLKGYNRTIESRIKQSATMRGKVWYCDPVTGVTSKFVEGKHPDGWLRGMRKTVMGTQGISRG